VDALAVVDAAVSTEPSDGYENVPVVAGVAAGGELTT
jgi:hypothetical protein